MTVRFRIPEIVLGMLIASSLFILVFLFASTQPPQPAKDQQTASECGGGNCEGQIRETFWQRTITDPVAFFTLWVAVFTLVLGAATIGLLRATNRSAQIAERALVGLERPVVYVDIATTGIGLSGGMMLKPSGVLGIRLTNYGRFPADVWNIQPTISVFPKTGFPAPVIPTRNETRNMPPGVVVGENVPYIHEVDLNEPAVISDDEWIAVQAGQSHIAVLGYVRYAGSHQQRYVVCFCAVFDWRGKRFVLKGDPQQYNYTYTETE